MELQLKNIGMIKEANVKIDGLTVIAGENDTGKSTVGKALFMYLTIYNYFIKQLNSEKVESIDNIRNSIFKDKLKNKLNLKSHIVKYGETIYI